MVGTSEGGRQRDRRGGDRGGRGDGGRRGGRGTGGEGEKARGGRAGRGEGEGIKGREISPPRSFLKVGAYAVHRHTGRRRDIKLQSD